MKCLCNLNRFYPQSLGTLYGRMLRQRAGPRTINEMEASGDPSEVKRQIKFYSIIHMHNLIVHVPFHIHSNAYTYSNTIAQAILIHKQL